ncbi:MAG TPA: dienelactone hydrolase family protein, partial [Gemmatimonadota bacterium]|nr:dienelactone hydrolase family protein [Gemmatimonadota bacterium]
MNRRSLAHRSAVATLAFLLVVGSGCADTGAESAASDEPAASAATRASSPDSVPAAILGQAPPPRGEDVHYVPGDSATAGYLVVPEGDGPFPAVILIHEWDGLNERVRQVADAFADEGYVALAADLFEGRTGANREENMALVQEARANPGALIANLNAAVEFLRARDDVTGRVGTMGWCFGGGVALSYALGGEQHDATAMFYGSLVTDPDSLAALDHEIYGTFAAEDDGIPPDQVEQFVTALREAGVENDVHVYDAVDHGFWLWVDQDFEARSEPALDAWTRLKA